MRFARTIPAQALRLIDMNRLFSRRLIYIALTSVARLIDIGLASVIRLIDTSWSTAAEVVCKAIPYRTDFGLNTNAIK